MIPRLKAAVRLKQAQDRADQISQMLLASKADLEKDLFKRDRDHKEICEAMVLGMPKQVEHRNTKTGAHLLRLQRYCRCLATKAAELPNFSEQITPELIDALECCVPLHDIGTVALPDHLLLKPGRLDSDERLHMQQHTIVGVGR